jgi:hypothetical protein
MELAKTKKCQGCKKTLELNLFADEEKEEKYYSKCEDCREKINSKYKKNFCEICGIRASFNFAGEKSGRFCKEHSLPGMVNVKDKTCETDGCKVQPYYNFEGKTKGRFCKEHSLPGMVNVKSKTCETDGCKVIPNYNFQAETRGRFCKKHSLPGMVNVKDKTCETDGCKVIPNYNFQAETRGRFCKEHSLPGMVNVKSKTCETDGCKVIPNYNFQGETRGRFCKKHSLTGMIDVKNKTCETYGCKFIPHYNFQGETKGRFCKDHSLTGMVNVKDKTCEADGCKVIPNYNFEGETRGRFCKDHSLTGMVNVKSKTCETDGCKVRARHGYCGQSPAFCAQHRDQHPDKKFLYLKPKRTCIGNDTEDCKDLATYGITEPKHCEEHSTENEICLIAQKCKNCNKNDLLNREGLCITYCQPTEIHKKIKQEKVKEKTVLNYLDKYIKDLSVVSDDRQIPNSCGIKNRPDRLYDCGTHYLIIEVDENQHRGEGYLDTCELVRMINIQYALGMNCIFLRFNPDNFRINGKLQKVNMNERLKLLVKWIERCKEMKPEKELEPVRYKYLFYDDYDITDVEFKIIDDLEINSNKID